MRLATTVQSMFSFVGSFHSEWCRASTSSYKLQACTHYSACTCVALNNGFTRIWQKWKTEQNRFDHYYHIYWITVLLLEALAPLIRNRPKTKDSSKSEFIYSIGPMHQHIIALPHAAHFYLIRENKWIVQNSKQCNQIVASGVSTSVAVIWSKDRIKF